MVLHIAVLDDLLLTLGGLLVNSVGYGKFFYFCVLVYVICLVSVVDCIAGCYGLLFRVFDCGWYILLSKDCWLLCSCWLFG